MRYVVDNLDADKDGWPEGLGNVERDGMGEEKLDNTVYLIRGLYDLADLARAKGETATRAGRSALADRLRARFDATWWNAPPSSTRTRSATATRSSSSSTGPA